MLSLLKGIIITHVPTKLYQLLISGFFITLQTRSHTHTDRKMLRCWCTAQLIERQYVFNIQHNNDKCSYKE